MIPAGLTPLVNHLWQSTLFAAGAWLLTLALRRNRAAVRYSIWLAASIKFLIPFSWLVIAGNQFSWRESPVRPAQFFFMIDEVGRMPYSASPPAMPFDTGDGQASSVFPEALLLGVWLCGFTIGLIVWVRKWRQVRAAVRAATPLNLNAPIQVLSSPTRLEPGVFGLRRPVLLLPEGITEGVTESQLELILAHELCHVKRRDNLTAAIHMVVESIFWFYPVLWWIRTRLIEERERACDEEVLKMAGDPNVYAEGILNVCRFYLSSPLICASGVSGADLKKRIEAIVENRAAHSLDFSRKFLLAAAGLGAVAGPVAIGVLSALPSRGQAPLVQTVNLSHPGKEFEVASIKPHKGADDGFHIQIDQGRWRLTNVPVSLLLGIAYDLRPGQLTGAPNWVESEHYDIEAKLDESAPANPKMDELRPYLQNLLEKRFQLQTHRETKDMQVYVLGVSKTGVKMKEAETTTAGPRIRMGLGQLTCTKISIDALARELSRQLDRPVLNETGLKGAYDVELTFAPEAPPAPGAGGNAPTIFTAVQEQLGLKLDSRKAPVELLVVDRVERAGEN